MFQNGWLIMIVTVDAVGLSEAPALLFREADLAGRAGVQSKDLWFCSGAGVNVDHD